MAASDRIKVILQAAFTPSSIEVIDESHKHASHAHAMKRRGAASERGRNPFSRQSWFPKHLEARAGLTAIVP